MIALVIGGVLLMGILIMANKAGSVANSVTSAASATQAVVSLADKVVSDKSRDSSVVSEKSRNQSTESFATRNTVDSCRSTGESRFLSAFPDSCRGIWNIYASIPKGIVWYRDKLNSDPLANRIGRDAQVIQERLNRCGVTAHLSLSDWFNGFTPGLLVVHSNPHSSEAQAREELLRTKNCGIDGYAKGSSYQLAGRD
jgi:hypothetical protein